MEDLLLKLLTHMATLSMLLVTQHNDHIIIGITIHDAVQNVVAEARCGFSTKR